jgi:poly-gamma-glutamate synthesis protein (capsule biosynthesis protein)
MQSLMVASALIFAATTASAQECRRLSNGARLSATGDVLIHKALYENIVKSPQHFKILWSKMIPTLKDSDLTVGNLEGPVAPGVSSTGHAVQDPGLVYDGQVYSGTHFLFNYHPQLIKDLMASGFGLVTTANNHAMDRGSLGADRTVEQLNDAGLDFVGTRSSDSTAARSRIVNIGSFRVGVVACTQMINGNPDPHKQVLLCDSGEVVDSIHRLKSQTDGVIVFPHWGEEYQTRPNSYQTTKARQWVNAGAVAIIGNHPHVVQTTEWISRPDGGQALVVYSLGNFVAAQAAMERRVSAVVHLDLAMAPGGVRVAQFSYTPFVRPSGTLALTPVRSTSAEAKYMRTQLGDARCE